MDSGSGSGTGVFSDDYESLISTTDADLLKRSWRNEKAAPEILKFEGALVHRSTEQIQLMEETVEELMQNGEDPLTVSLYQMDIDRTTFLLRSYLRTRLQKIEKFMFHIQKTADLWARLSTQEQKFARRSIEDMKQHFEQSVLSNLPERYNSHSKQSVISEEDDMVSYVADKFGFVSSVISVAEPKLDSFVICRTRKFLGALPVDDRQVILCLLLILYERVLNYCLTQTIFDDSGEENPLDMYAGDIYALRYKSIKPLIESGQLDLV
ncbi:DNA replication complex GINS protein SLD5 [Tanacetum coccineum]